MSSVHSTGRLRRRRVHHHRQHRHLFTAGPALPILRIAALTRSDKGASKSNPSHSKTCVADAAHGDRKTNLVNAQKPIVVRSVELRAAIAEELRAEKCLARSWTRIELPDRVRWPASEASLEIASCVASANLAALTIVDKAT